MLSAAHTRAAISNSYLPISNYMTTQPQRFIAGAAHVTGKRGVAHSVQQRSKQGEVGPSVQCIRIRGKTTFG